MIGFSDKNWTILPQVKRVKGVEIEVPVKQVRMLRTEDPETGDVMWMPLDRPFYQILLRGRSCGTFVKVKMYVDKPHGVRIEEFRRESGPKSLWTYPVFQREKVKAVKVTPEIHDSASIELGMVYVIIRFGAVMARAIDDLFLEMVDKALAKIAKAEGVARRRVLRAAKKAAKEAKMAARKEARELRKAA